MQYSIIPAADNFAQTTGLIREYGVNLEYNDFFDPSIYDSEKEINRLIDLYSSIECDRSGDTLHGGFMELDITSDDPVLRKRSRTLFRQSMVIGERLGVRALCLTRGFWVA